MKYDSDARSQLPNEELLQQAIARGLQVINVVCDDPTAKRGDTVGMSFIALVSHIPRTGERLQLDDNSICVVQTVLHKMTRVRDGSGNDAVTFLPNVYAQRIQGGGAKGDEGAGAGGVKSK